MYKCRCISFYSLAKSPKGANVSPGFLEALLSEDHLLSENEAPACDDVTLPVEAAEVAIDRADYVEERRDDRLTYYIAGYVARKRIFSTQCEACKDACPVTRDSVMDRLPAESCKKFCSISCVHFLLKGLNQHAVQNIAKKVKPCIM
ncbi:hypothetical protein MRX96_029623 [Rhipicephalus microplus]